MILAVMKLALPLLFGSVIRAHFTLDYPPARGFDEDQLPTFPCGGQNSVSSNRTEWPLAGGPIQLTMEHDRSAVQVLLGIGNDVGDAFNAILVPTTQEEGIGKFCLSDVVIPNGLGLKEGDNATIQVVTNGDPNGGLYNCADITFAGSNSSTTSECMNGKGVSTTKYIGKFSNANGTGSTEGGPVPSTSTGTASSSTASPVGGAGSLQMGGFLIISVFVVEMLALWL